MQHRSIGFLFAVRLNVPHPTATDFFLFTVSDPLLQVFVLTVVFGLYHGLILFPALLAMFGPEGGPPPPSNSSVLGESKGGPPSNISVLGESNPGRDNQTFVSDLVSSSS